MWCTGHLRLPLLSGGAGGPSPGDSVPGAPSGKRQPMLGADGPLPPCGHRPRPWLGCEVDEGGRHRACDDAWPGEALEACCPHTLAHWTPGAGFPQGQRTGMCPWGLVEALCQARGKPGQAEQARAGKRGPTAASAPRCGRASCVPSTRRSCVQEWAAGGLGGQEDAGLVPFALEPLLELGALRSVGHPAQHLGHWGHGL